MGYFKMSKTLLALPLTMLLFFTANCGEADESYAFGDSDYISVQTYPTSPLVIHAERIILLPGHDGVVTNATLGAPNMQLKLEIDNKNGDKTITILLAHLAVTGPKGLKNIYIGTDKLFETRPGNNDEDIQFPALRGYIVQIRPGRKSTCMHKVDYLGLASDTSACPADLEEIDISEGGEPGHCCPTGPFSLANSWLYVDKLQDFTQDELADPGLIFQSYTFEMTLIGWFGGANFPEANLRKKYFFSSNGL